MTDSEKNDFINFIYGQLKEREAQNAKGRDDDKDDWDGTPESGTVSSAEEQLPAKQDKRRKARRKDN